MFLQEFCDGGTLLDKVNVPNSYTALEGLRWMTEVACGMSYLHSRPGIRIAHRDLKLENIMLHQGRAKVGDFGLSRLIVGEHLNDNHVDDGHSNGEPSSDTPQQEQEDRSQAGTVVDMGGGVEPPPQQWSLLPQWSADRGSAKVLPTDGKHSSGAAARSKEANPPTPFARQSHADMTGKTGSCRYMAPVSR